MTADPYHDAAGSPIAPSMLATDLRYTALPQWLGIVFAARQRRVIDVDRLDSWGWHTWYRIALDASELPIVPRTLARVIVDYHGADALAVDVGRRRLAERVPCHPDSAHRGLLELTRTGWLGVGEHPGRVPTLVLLCPVNKPPTLAPRARVGVAPRATPLAPRATPPRATRDTTGHRGIGASSGADDISNRDASGAVPSR